MRASRHLPIRCQKAQEIKSRTKRWLQVRPQVRALRGKRPWGPAPALCLIHAKTRASTHWYMAVDDEQSSCPTQAVTKRFLWWCEFWVRCKEAQKIDQRKHRNLTGERAALPKREQLCRFSRNPSCPPSPYRVSLFTRIPLPTPGRTYQTHYSDTTV